MDRELLTFESYNLGNFQVRKCNTIMRFPSTLQIGLQLFQLVPDSSLHISYIPQADQIPI